MEDLDETAKRLVILKRIIRDVEKLGESEKAYLMAHLEKQALDVGRPMP